MEFETKLTLKLIVFAKGQLRSLYTMCSGAKVHSTLYIRGCTLAACPSRLKLISFFQIDCCQSCFLWLHGHLNDGVVLIISMYHITLLLLLKQLKPMVLYHLFISLYPQNCLRWTNGSQHFSESYIVVHSIVFFHASVVL